MLPLRRFSRAKMTLGMMLAVQFIIGQLNIPVNQSYVSSASSQDAKISLTTRLPRFITWKMRNLMLKTR
jgi:hypothetical protein